MTMPGLWEILIIVLIIIVIFGGNKAMDTVKKLGKEVYEVKKKVKELDDLKKGKF